MTLVATDSSTSTLAQTDPRVKDQAQKFVLTLSCVEQPGIVQAVTTFLFERGFNMMEVSTITGHKSLQMLKRYTHLKAEDLVARLG